MTKQKFLSQVIEGKAFISNVDQNLKFWIDKIEQIPFSNERKKSRSHFETLTLSIISQQISTKAADAIAKRVALASGGSISIESVQSLKFEDLRECGLSANKVRSIQELTEYFCEHQISQRSFAYKSDREIKEMLTQIWGIGPWTVDMFLMFSLRRLDVWPTGDLGVRKGWSIIAKSPVLSEKEFEKVGDAFKPFRSLVAWYCWKATDESSETW